LCGTLFFYYIPNTAAAATDACNIFFAPAFACHFPFGAGQQQKSSSLAMQIMVEKNERKMALPQKKMKMATLPQESEIHRWPENNAGHFDIFAPCRSFGAFLLFIPIL